MLLELSLETIKDRDPVFAEVFAKLFKQVIKDCEDRPGVNSSRTITMTVDVTPVTGVNASLLDGVNVEFSINAKTPKLASRSWPMNVRRDASVVFNPDTDDPRQGSLLDGQS